VATVVAEGPPVSTIVDFAKTGAFDLIVMGTHGRTGMAHALLGSVAERVVRMAPCSVLTTRGE
jgi:nucleotide-binding universal stress UspA family protein